MNEAGVSYYRTGPRREAARRRAAARRRRLLLGACGIGLVVLVVFLTMPTVKKAVNNFNLPLSYADIIRRQADDKHLDPALIAGVIYAETKFDPRPSSAGAQGLMQILPGTAKLLARRSGATTFRVADLATPEVNIAYGSYYLRYLINHYRGSTTLALAAYNGGLTNVDRWVAKAQAQGGRLTAARIPFPETRAYVFKVLWAQRQYRSSYPRELGYT